MKKILFFVLASLIFAYAEIIEVGTGNSYRPFAYVSEKNEAIG